MAATPGSGGFWIVLCGRYDVDRLPLRIAARLEPNKTSLSAEREIE
jgi:hypothetical protein